MGSSIGFTLTGLWLARLCSDTRNLREFILPVLPLSFSKHGKKLEIILPHTGPIRELSERRAERTLCWSTLPNPLRPLVRNWYVALSHLRGRNAPLLHRRRFLKVAGRN